MAEALGVAASIITIVQITKEIVALAKRNIHTTDHAHSVLSSLLGRLTAYKGLFEGLQLQAESHEADAIRLSALDHVGGPLEACKESLSFIKDALQRPRGKLWIGKVLNKDIMKALEKLDQLRPILQTALEADQRVLLAAIEDYAKNISQDLHKLQSTAEDLQENVKSSINDQELWREEVTATRKAAEGLAKRKNILDWISTLDQSGRHQILIEAHHSGTNEWFMRSLDFTEWFTCKSTNLWLYGTVGSGKSVQSALIIQYTELARTETLDATKALGYYFFDDNDNDEQSVTGFLCSLIKQLSIDFGNLPEVVKELYAKYSGDRNCNSIKQEYLIETLAAMIDLHSSTCVVLDAIDELPESDIYSLFGILEQLSGRSGTKLQFFCTSRPTQIISDEVTRLGWRSTTMNVEEIDKDVSKYVKDCLGSKRSFSQLEAGLKESICSRILQRTQGM
ncbi:hypothetical protein K491DRAFT_291504 [Lophiostoma macrostomum CBS 122681]|uniref:Nephrocystin 3-like N-terminal domain-containing protein n=1 Tax=Lophiostoma macrostomum CBS 122681 TaxID=1314788 RepID=A0A6A6SIN0_9PLEO|nr:hypothetical protein K491DRAFT_291504 [Lophiostoma macrostomum CBS 122681]